jgi:hypothetical protein
VVDVDRCSMAMVLENVKDERYFSTLSFMMNKLNNKFNPFGSSSVDVCTKLLYFENIPIYCNYQLWNQQKDKGPHE